MDRDELDGVYTFEDVNEAIYKPEAGDYVYAYWYTFLITDLRLQPDGTWVADGDVVDLDVFGLPVLDARRER